MHCGPGLDVRPGVRGTGPGGYRGLSWLARPAIPRVTMGPLLEDPLWISMSAGMATDIDAEKDIIAQLADVGWAMEQTNTPPRVWVTTECQKADFEPRVCLHIGGPGRPTPARGGRLAVAVLPGLALAAASDRIRCFSTRRQRKTAASYWPRAMPHSRARQSWLRASAASNGRNVRNRAAVQVPRTQSRTVVPLSRMSGDRQSATCPVPHPHGRRHASICGRVDFATRGGAVR